MYRKILWQKETNTHKLHIDKLRSNKEIEEYTNIHYDMRKRPLKCYGHIQRMKPTRLTMKIEVKLKLRQWSGFPQIQNTLMMTV